jgi:hypothetical protein
MNRLPRLKVALALLLFSATGALAQPLALPLEIRQPDTLWNFQSQRGVPISTVSNVPPGSDGRMTNFNSSGTGLLPTTNQFKNLVAFGGVPGLKLADWLARSNSTILRNGTNVFSATVATEMRLPVGNTTTGMVMVLRRGQIGAPYLMRQVSFPFGSVVDVPSTDENGIPLTNIVASAYWQPQPYSTNSHTNAPYYWSPHAQKVYAIQPGPMAIRWVKAAYSTTVPPDYATNSANYYTNAGNYFRIFTANYIVSGAPVKPPRKIYWTERGFRMLSKPITVPAARVGAVNIAYNSLFLRTVANQYVGPGDSSPTDGGTNQPLPELRTLWYDQQQGQGTIYAYNIEGRAFLELLGDLRPDGQTREQLGFEIVDVFKQPSPLDVRIELGDRVTPPPPGSVEELTPEPVLQIGAPAYAYQHHISGSENFELFATRETQNVNDYLVHWMETGVVGLKWPALFGRYEFVWPTDVARYSHYVRPLVATEDEAKLTSVPLPTLNVPTIEYQDPLDRPRGKLTETFRFYTFLEPANPLHRTLLRFNSGEHVAFERVFSWLDASLKSGSFAGNSIAAHLDAWNPTNSTLQFPDPLVAPRVVTQDVAVGQRVQAPAGEVGTRPGDEYYAGHIHDLAGRSYNPFVYADPFVVGFSVANLGAIIPVNAIPGTNSLEVWWFRPNQANASQGFVTNHWPSVIGRYTIQWPTSSREIVLASKQGSEADGPLNSFESTGIIYAQNDPALTGYNPNEEHAIMSAGIAYATRDDLNITNAIGYSSYPFVLLQYVAGDDRPAMSVFKVLREKPSAGWVFDYITEAGRKLEAPMPLPLLAKPVEGSGDNAVNYNTEPTGGGGDLPGAWNAATHTNGPFGHYNKFTFKDRKNDFWVYRGLHAGLPTLRAGTYVAATRTFINLSNATAVVGQPFSLTLHASRQDEFLAIDPGTLPAWLSASALTLQGTPVAGNIGINSVPLVVYDQYDGARWTNTLSLRIIASGAVATQGPLTLISTNSFTGTQNTFSNRPPFLGVSPAPSNSFTMRFYYKTEPSFAWPGVATPPAAGSIVPYLRPLTNGVFVGDPASKDTPSLQIVYRPVWPVRDTKDATKPVPTVPYGLTLTMPGAGGLPLPGIRDWKTARVLYQQSIAANVSNAAVSVVLHDPTREKSSGSIDQYEMPVLPASVRAESYQGKVYFPNLPPHLGKRLFFDPARGAKGSLVLKGEFHDETIGEDYLQLNVLRGSDLAAAMALCPPTDTENHPKWTNAIAALSTAIETFYESPTVPGSYIPDPARTVSVGVGDLAEVSNDNVAVDSYALSASGPGAGYITLVQAGGTAFTQPGDPVDLFVMKVGGSLYPGEVKVLPAENPLSEFVTFQHKPDLAGRFTEYEYEWKIAAPVNGLPPDSDATMSRYLALADGLDLPRYLLGGSGIQVLGDNWLTLRYRPKNTAHPLYNQWSDWTEPRLAEGWIKRVLAGINPFNQRIRDLFNNAVNTDASILTQAGARWEGDVALNLDTINNYGLIEIYETVLRRGRSISIESGYNYGPANDALLLAAGYLNDLYMMVGNEAWADAANPTIGIGTADNTYGDIATALFAFKGQVASLLEEELALVRGRDDFLQPSVGLRPIYNRLVWNYTRGIDAGEVIYALNYNIQENANATPDGIINAEDAARMFPMGHGDAYGHYLTALKGYYSLLLNENFDWVPRIEAVNVLGVPVSVDYQDERKFAAAAAAVARAGRQIFDLTWRQDFQANHASGWSHLSAKRVNPQRTYTTGLATNQVTRYWGLDHWAARTGQGTYLNWVVGNAILPAVDPNPNHEGIQKIDRTTVMELTELVTQGTELQSAMDHAEGGLTPLGLPAGSVALDIDPNVVVGGDNGTHFEQVFTRAKVALNNAVAAFDDAKDVTRLMRSEQDSLADFQAGVARQELAFNNTLIEIYGTPYTDDIGPGKTYKQGYAGPDLVHYNYVEIPESRFGSGLPALTNTATFKIDIQQFPSWWSTDMLSTTFDFYEQYASSGYSNGVHYLQFELDPHAFYNKPPAWTGRRVSPGRLQQAISEVIRAHARVEQAFIDAEYESRVLDRRVAVFKSYVDTGDATWALERDKLIALQTLQSAEFANAMFGQTLEIVNKVSDMYMNALTEAFPRTLIAGLAAGGDLTSAARAAVHIANSTTFSVSAALKYAADFVVRGLGFATTTANQWIDLEQIQILDWDQELKDKVVELGEQMGRVQGHYFTMNSSLRALDDAQRKYDALVAEGDRIQMEREIARQRTSAVIQGYRTRDAAFRIFRNEKLERYKTLFDMSARYAFLAANAYDFETGLLDSSAGRAFVNRIIASRALGVVRQGEPQYAGSNSGDPGLSSALAEMKADWDVLRGRLGFNNPDAYGTTVSLRTENYRILPTTNSDPTWTDLLQQHRVRNVLEDADVRRHCREIARGDGLPVPGIVLEFSTTIAHGYNLFGQPLAAGDHAFSPGSFATKIFGLGASLEGYRGMDTPAANDGTGGNSPDDPPNWYLDPLALAATPYVYLIPVGVDSMRAPPLGTVTGVRSWMVEDVAIPLPFNVGSSEFANGGMYLSGDSLSEPLFNIRMHQAFRPVPSASFFSTSLYGSAGTLLRSQYTNNRLVGRSAWNSRWKLVIPGHTLLNDPDEGLERFMKTVRDIRLHFVTYSYSGN